MLNHHPSSPPQIIPKNQAIFPVVLRVALGFPWFFLFREKTRFLSQNHIVAAQKSSDFSSSGATNHFEEV